MTIHVLFQDELVRTLRKQPVFHCEECDRFFRKKKGLRSHVAAVHNNKKRFGCTDCRKHYVSEQSLQEHYQRMHGCAESDVRLAREEQDARHSSRRRVDGSYWCEEPGCARVRFSKFGLRRHTELFHKKRSFRCLDCGVGFAYLRDFDKHMLGHKKGKNFVCYLCQQRFLSDKQLVAHQKLCKPVIERSLESIVYTKCSESLKTDGLLALDRLTDCDSQHQWFNPTVSYACDQCDKVFETKINMTIHKMFEHDVYQHWAAQQQILSETCDSAIDVASDLDSNSSYESKDAEVAITVNAVSINERHQSIHDQEQASSNDQVTGVTDGAKFSCSFCGTVFPTRTDSQIHEIRVRVSGDLKMCYRCGKTFEALCQLPAHYEKVHKQVCVGSYSFDELICFYESNETLQEVNGHEADNQYQIDTLIDASMDMDEGMSSFCAGDDVEHEQQEKSDNEVVGNTLSISSASCGNLFSLIFERQKHKNRVQCVEDVSMHPTFVTSTSNIETTQAGDYAISVAQVQLPSPQLGMSPCSVALVQQQSLHSTCSQSSGRSVGVSSSGVEPSVAASKTSFEMEAQSHQEGSCVDQHTQTSQQQFNEQQESHVYTMSAEQLQCDQQQLSSCDVSPTAREAFVDRIASSIWSQFPQAEVSCSVTQQQSFHSTCSKSSGKSACVSSSGVLEPSTDASKSSFEMQVQSLQEGLCVDQHTQTLQQQFDEQRESPVDTMSAEQLQHDQPQLSTCDVSPTPTTNIQIVQPESFAGRISSLMSSQFTQVEVSSGGVQQQSLHSTCSKSSGKSVCVSSSGVIEPSTAASKTLFEMQAQSLQDGLCVDQHTQTLQQQFDEPQESPVDIVSAEQLQRDQPQLPMCDVSPTPTTSMQVVEPESFANTISSLMPSQFTSVEVSSGVAQQQFLHSTCSKSSDKSVGVSSSGVLEPLTTANKTSFEMQVQSLHEESCVDQHTQTLQQQFDEPRKCPVHTVSAEQLQCDQQKLPSCDVSPTASIQLVSFVDRIASSMRSQFAQVEVSSGVAQQQSIHSTCSKTHEGLCLDQYTQTVQQRFDEPQESLVHTVATGQLQCDQQQLSTCHALPTPTTSIQLIQPETFANQISSSMPSQFTQVEVSSGVAQTPSVSQPQSIQPILADDHTNGHVPALQIQSVHSVASTAFDLSTLQEHSSAAVPSTNFNSYTLPIRCAVSQAMSLQSWPVGTRLPRNHNLAVGQFPSFGGLVSGVVPSVQSGSSTMPIVSQPLASYFSSNVQPYQPTQYYWHAPAFQSRYSRGCRRLHVEQANHSNGFYQQPDYRAYGGSTPIDYHTARPSYGSASGFVDQQTAQRGVYPACVPAVQYMQPLGYSSPVLPTNYTSSLVHQQLYQQWQYPWFGQSQAQFGFAASREQHCLPQQPPSYDSIAYNIWSMSPMSNSVVSSVCSPSTVTSGQVHGLRVPPSYPSSVIQGYCYQPGMPYSSTLSVQSRSSGLYSQTRLPQSYASVSQPHSFYPVVSRNQCSLSTPSMCVSSADFRSPNSALVQPSFLLQSCVSSPVVSG